MSVQSKRVLSSEQADLLRQIPSVDDLLAQPRLSALATRVDRGLLVEITRAALADLRARITGEEHGALQLSPDGVESFVANMVERLLARSLWPVINATGVILHTNLGRAPLASAVIDELRRTAVQFSNLEYDLEAGARGKRDVHTAELLRRLTGAEDAVVVNNCAAAVLVVLAALAKNGEVIVSRGELIEIGDGFRIPEIMAESGALLREVGTTNRTRLADYENAVGEKTRLLLRVHPSNFEMTGFTDKPSLEDLVALSQRTGLPLMEDLGSGCLLDLSPYGITEPTVRKSIEAGVGLVTFSGDKLLGGPQAGIVVGRAALIERLRRHPLMRAIRPDKLTLAALEETLAIWAQPPRWREIPIYRMLTMAIDEIDRRARAMAAALADVPGTAAAVINGASTVGGGSAPGSELPTRLVAVGISGISAAALEGKLRAADPPIITRIDQDRVLIDLRSVDERDDDVVVRAISSVK